MNQEYLKSKVFYNSENGKFFSIKTNKEIGPLNKKGYILISINKKLFRAHRLAWLYNYGYMPNDQIDHINGIRHDNKIKNLRIVTNQENQWNRKINKKTITGYKGIKLHKPSGKYQALLKINKKSISFGYFNKIEHAIKTLQIARVNYHKEYANNGI